MQTNSRHLLHISSQRDFPHPTPFPMTAIPAVRRDQPLPQNPFHGKLDPAFHAAYEQCFRHEEASKLLKEQAKTKYEEGRYTKEVIFGRCLGYLLTETPHTNGKRMVSDDIIKCDGQREKLNLLAETYIRDLILFCQWVSFTSAQPTYVNVSDSPRQGGNA